MKNGAIIAKVHEEQVRLPASKIDRKYNYKDLVFHLIKNGYERTLMESNSIRVFSSWLKSKSK